MRWTSVHNAICGAIQMVNIGAALTVDVRVKNNFRAYSSVVRAADS